MFDIETRLNDLTYLLEEIREEKQHNFDLITDRELLHEDFKAIKAASNTRRIKLYVDYYFKR